MAVDLILAYLHFILVFLMVFCLSAELLLVRKGMDFATLARIGPIDGLYGLGALLLLVIGFARVYFGLKPSDYYWSSMAFHIKLGLFILIAIASVPPTVRFIQWRKQFAAGTRSAISDVEIAGVRRWIHIEAALLLAIPLFAGLLARAML
jgi:putative membrane protein